MNKRIRSMIDAIFAEMKMTAENLALRDELMANAQARYEDMISQGRTEEEAFAQVAASLEDVGDLLREMNGEPAAQEPAKEEAPRSEDGVNEDAGEEETEAKAEEVKEEAKSEPAAPQSDLGDALNKAFTMLGDWGQSIMPQAKKLVRQMDDATGGVISEIGRAVEKGVKDAQKAAGEMLDKVQQEKPDAKDAEWVPGKTPEDMREEAKDLRAQAGLKRAIGDNAGADTLEAQADALENEADMMDQTAAMEQARAEAHEQTDAQPQEASFPFPQESVLRNLEAIAREKENAAGDGAQTPDSSTEDESTEDTFTTEAEQLSREAERLVREAGSVIETLGRQAGDALNEAVNGKRDPQNQEVRFPVAGLRRIDIKLDADDVEIEPTSGDEIIVCWAAQNANGEPAVSMNNHTLCIRRKNPDVFKTFFSVFTKNGGKIIVRVPRGYAADYAISTTSGDVHISAVDVDDVTVSTTSGDVLLSPDTGVRARNLKIETISGCVKISALAIAIAAKSVSGEVFVSCDCQKVSCDVVSGKLHIEGACDEWDVNTVSGKAELICTVVPAGKIKADTISGNLMLALPSSIRGFVLEFDSMGGKLINEFGPDRFGTCALPIRLNTLSGCMTVTRL